MRLIAEHKSKLTSSLLMILSETAIVFYAFFLVPSSARINLPDLVLAPFFDDIVPMPNDLHYLIPVLVLLLIVIWPLGCSRISVWLIGTVVLYLELSIYIVSSGIMYNAFGFTADGGMGAVPVVIMPFWCIFFFLWELLLCAAAKLWRKKRGNNQQKQNM